MEDQQKQIQTRKGRAKVEAGQSRVFQALLTRAQTAGLNLAEVCRRARIRLSVVNYWKRNEPKSLRLWLELNDVIDDELAAKCAVAEGADSAADAPQIEPNL